MNKVLERYFYRIAFCLTAIIVGIGGVSSLIVKGIAAEDHYTYLPIVTKP